MIVDKYSNYVQDFYQSPREDSIERQINSKAQLWVSYPYKIFIFLIAKKKIYLPTTLLSFQ